MSNNKNKAIIKIPLTELGFFRIAVASPINKVADISQNKENIVEEINKAYSEQAKIILFPQLAITSASCGDLFFEQVLLKESFKALKDIIAQTKDKPIISIIGLPLRVENNLYSTAAVIFGENILGLIPLEPPKQLANIFSYPKTSDMAFFNNIPCSLNFKFDIKINEEDFFSFGVGNYALLNCNNKNIHLIFLPLAKPSKPLQDIELKNEYRALSKQTNSAICFSNCGIGESSSNFVFLGETGIFEDGEELCYSSYLSSFDHAQKIMPNNNLQICDVDIETLQTKRIKATKFYKINPNKQEDAVNVCMAEFPDLQNETANSLYRNISSAPFFNNIKLEENIFQEIIFMQAIGLIKRLEHLNCQKCVIGISGGLDSTLALLVTLYAFDIMKISHKNLYAVLMPGFGTTSNTKTNAEDLANLLDCTVLRIDIQRSVLQHFEDIEHNQDEKNAVYENAQARERTQILMDLANKIGGIMIGTGDLSEAALGWTTYNGDHISMYDINSSIPKTLISNCLLRFVNDKLFFDDPKNNTLEKIILKIIKTPISPELLPAKQDEIVQKTEDLIGPYELHDFFLYNILEKSFSPKKIFYLAKIAFGNKYSNMEILKWIKVFYSRFFSQQFKRKASADGVNATGFGFSSWSMPSDSINKIWLQELENLTKIV